MQEGRERERLSIIIFQGRWKKKARERERVYAKKAKRVVRPEKERDIIHTRGDARRQREREVKYNYIPGMMEEKSQRERESVCKKGKESG